MDKWGVRVAQAGGIAIAKVLGQNRSLNYSFHQKEVSVAQAGGVRETAEAETHLGLGARVARSFLATRGLWSLHRVSWAPRGGGVKLL